MMRWLIHIINSVDKTKLSDNRSTLEHCDFSGFLNVSGFVNEKRVFFWRGGVGEIGENKKRAEEKECAPFPERVTGKKNPNSEY